MPRSQSILDKAIGKIEVGAADCWRWQGQIDRHGYGRISVDGSPRLAHRAVYECLVGAIPAGLEIDHLCRVRDCVNPDHLEPVSHKTNMNRSPLAWSSAHPGRRHVIERRVPLTGPDDPRHGTRSTYVNYGCRCDRCRAASNAKYVPVANPRPVCRVAKVDGQLTPDDPRHGTLNGYSNHNCRCPQCKAANTAAHADYMARRRARREAAAA